MIVPTVVEARVEKPQRPKVPEVQIFLAAHDQRMRAPTQPGKGPLAASEALRIIRCS